MPPQPRRKSLGDALKLVLLETRRRVEAGVRSRETLSMHEAHVRYLLEHVGARFPLHRLNARKVEAVLTAEARGRRTRADGSVRALSGGTLRKRACTLRRALVLSKRRGWIRRVPEFPETPYRYVPVSEHLEDLRAYARVRDSLESPRRLWFVAAVWTGQRASDVERMRREDLDVDYCAVRIRSTKTKRAGRWFHAAPELVRELEAHWRRLPAGAKLVPPWPHVSSQLTRLSARLGMPRLTAQRLRHSFFTWYVAANGFSAELLELGGWKDMAVPSLVYAHAAPKRLKEQIERTHRQLMGRGRAPRKVSREREPTPLSMVPNGSGGSPPASGDPPKPARAEPDSARGMGVPRDLPPTSAIVAGGGGGVSRVGVERIELSTNGLRVRPASPVPTQLPGSVVLHPRSQSHGHHRSHPETSHARGRQLLRL
jgi:integrase